MQRFNREFAIAGRPIGPGRPPYVIAEMSGNHNGSLDRALKIIEAAYQAGADAVKLQTYRADTITIDHDGPEFTVDHPLWKGRTLYDLYEEAHTPWDWHETLFARGRELGITVFSSPFDDTAIALLQSLDAPAYKIASSEIVDPHLIRAAAATGKPLILSTGMATFDEITAAVDAAHDGGCRDLALLHCVAGYPTPYGEAHLANIHELQKAFPCLIGLSDHTLGTAAPIAATALGATIIEKHLTLSRDDGGVDSAFSLEPDELRLLVDETRNMQAAIGEPKFGPKPSEMDSLGNRRSLYIVQDVAAGAALTGDNVRSIRPGAGLPPRHLDDVIGRKAARGLKRGEPLAWDMIED